MCCSSGKEGGEPANHSLRDGNWSLTHSWKSSEWLLVAFSPSCKCLSVTLKFQQHFTETICNTPVVWLDNEISRVIVWSYLIVEYHLFCIEINHTWHWVSSVEGQAHQGSHYRSPQGSTILQLHQHFISIALCSTLPLDPFHSSIPASVLFHQSASHVPMYMISNCIDLHPPGQKDIYCTWSGEKNVQCNQGELHVWPISMHA